MTVSIERAAVDLPSISTSYGQAVRRLYQFATRVSLDDQRRTWRGHRGSQRAQCDFADSRSSRQSRRVLDQAIKVADKFLQRGQVVLLFEAARARLRTKISRPNRDRQKHTAGRADQSRHSIRLGDCGGAVQDHDRGLIIGEGSFGKGLVQTIFPLSGGAGLTLTTARYYTPSGRLIQRDYSNGSVYDYLFRRNAQGETLIRRLTSKRGRPISAARSLVEAGSNRISRLRRPS